MSNKIAVVEVLSPTILACTDTCATTYIRVSESTLQPVCSTCQARTAQKWKQLVMRCNHCLLVIVSRTPERWCSEQGLMNDWEKIFSIKTAHISEERKVPSALCLRRVPTPMWMSISHFAVIIRYSCVQTLGILPRPTSRIAAFQRVLRIKIIRHLLEHVVQLIKTGQSAIIPGSYNDLGTANDQIYKKRKLFGSLTSEFKGRDYPCRGSC